MTPDPVRTLVERETRFTFDSPLSTWVVAAILIATTVLVVALYVRDLRTKRARGRWPLMLLRLMLVACMAYILLEPTIVDHRTYREESTVIVLVDASKSMERHDTLARPELRLAVARLAGLLTDEQRAQLAQGAGLDAVLTKEQQSAIDGLARIVPVKNLLGRADGLLDALRAQHNVELLAFSSVATAVKLPEGQTLADLALVDEAETGRTTDVAFPLSIARKIGDKKRVAAIVLLTDGDANTGRNPVDEARLLSARNIPVYTVGVGNPDEPFDVALADVKSKKSVYVNDTVVVTADVQSSGYENQEVTVALRSKGETLSEEHITLSARARTRRVQLKFVPKHIGLMPCTVEIQPLESEIRDDNNLKAFELDVVKDKRKVLLVEQFPRWEWRFLKNAIGRDPDFDLTMVLFHSNERPARGEQYISHYPTTQDELYNYDIIIFGDVARDEFSLKQLELTRRFVQEKGRPFVMIAGELHAPYDFVGTPIEALLPVVLRTDPQARAGHSVDAGFNLEMTAAGWQHPIFMLENNREDNDRVWAELPPSYWCADIERAKAGATTLAVHPFLSNRYGKLPLVVAQQYGAGKVLMLNFDSTWRWRYDYGDVYHYRFWGNILRWLIATPLEGEGKYVRLSTDKTKYRQGETVTVTARVLDKTYYPFSAGPVFVEVTDPFASVERLRLELQDEKTGLYETRFTAATGGSWRLQSVVPDLGEEGTQAALVIDVEAAELEARSLRMRADLLKNIAEITRGRFHMLDTAAAIPKEIEERKMTSSFTERTGLWDVFPVILLFTAFITGEWLLRKRKGYV
jgi:uncharacterized membrane protein